MKLLPWLGSLLLSAALACQSAPQAGGPPGGGKGGKGPQAFPVKVATVAPQKIEYSIRASGAIQAFEEVAVTARVAGVVEKVHFAEGDIVKEGKSLVDIEVDRYSLAVAAASATKEKASAAADDAAAGLARREKATEGLFPEEEITLWRTKDRTAKAELDAAKVALSQAQINLRDARIKAPIAGTIETRTVATGQYVQPGTVIATILRSDPLLLRFKVPELEAARLAPGMPAKFTVRGDQSQREALITAVGGAADPGSRLVTITATINEANRQNLRPGVFAEVEIKTDSIEAIVVPELSVRPSEKGFLAYVIEEQSAKERTLELGLRTPDGMIEVKSGLNPGEQLVIRGAEALRNGAKVKIEGAGKGKDGEGKGKPPQSPDSLPNPNKEKTEPK